MEFYEIVFTILVIYLLYKLIFNIVVPVAKLSFQMRNRMKHMQQNAPAQPPRPNNTGTQPAKNSTTGTDSEYIDFEEIK